MDSYMKWMESQSKIVKILLAIPVIDLTWGIWRVGRYLKSNDNIELALAIISIIFCWVFGIIDIVMIAVTGSPICANTLKSNDDSSKK